MKQVRLLPIVVVATSALLVLKAIGLATGSGYTVGVDAAYAAGATAPASAEAPAQAVAPVAPNVVGDTLDGLPRPVEGGGDIVLRDLTQGAGQGASGDSGALVLERLAERRAELDAFAAELETRLALVEAAEMRLEQRMSELDAIEARITSTLDAQDDRENENFAGLVLMYENMRPADAAAIFNDLDTDVLVRVGRLMNPRKLGPVIAKMNPARAQSLTVLLAQADGAAALASPEQGYADLPQIIGQ